MQDLYRIHFDYHKQILVIVSSHLWQSRQRVVMQAGQLRIASLLGKAWEWGGCGCDVVAVRFLQWYLQRKSRSWLHEDKGLIQLLVSTKCAKIIIFSISALHSFAVSHRLRLASTQAWSLSSSSGSYSSSSFVGIIRCFRLRPVELPAEETVKNKQGCSKEIFVITNHERLVRSKK